MPEGTFRTLSAAEALAFMIAATEQARPYRLFDTRDPGVAATLALAEAIRGNTEKARAYLEVSRAITRYNQRGEA